MEPGIYPYPMGPFQGTLRARVNLLRRVRSD